MSNRLTIPVVLVCAISGASLAQAPATGLSSKGYAKTAGAPCTNPSARFLLGQDIAGLRDIQYLPLQHKIGPLRWAFLSWEGPPDGMVFVLSCDGQILAKRGLGFIDKLKAGPAVEGQSTVEARYVSGSGTDMDEHAVSLLAFDGKSIRVLWDHPSYDSSTMSTLRENPKTHQIIWRADTYSYAWSYLPARSMNKTAIDVTGVHEIDISGVIHKRAARPERYCYRSGKNEFVRC